MIASTVFPEFGKNMGMKTLDEYHANENAVKFHVHALKDIYLQSKLHSELTPGGDESSIYVFAAIAFFILVLAAVNFINLTTARASHRAREVGIRKAMGTSRRRLVWQFLGESVLISTISMVIAVVLAELVLIAFESITGTVLMGTIWKDPLTVLTFFGFSVFVGLLSGIYPAFYLTAFKPVTVLKGNYAAAGGGSFRNLLVVFQFTVSIVLIISSVVVQQQMHFMRTHATWASISIMF
jgi:putative ABC transport system permease protein